MGIVSTSLLWEPLWKSTLPPSPADKSHYDDVDWMEKKTPHFYATKWQICFCAPNNLTATAGYKCVCAGLCVNYNDRLWGWGLIKYRGVWCIQPLCYPVSHFPSKIKKLCLLQNQRARKEECTFHAFQSKLKMVEKREKNWLSLLEKCSELLRMKEENQNK